MRKALLAAVLSLCSASTFAAQRPAYQPQPGDHEIEFATCNATAKISIQPGQEDLQTLAFSSPTKQVTLFLNPVATAISANYDNGGGVENITISGPAARFEFVRQLVLSGQRIFVDAAVRPVSPTEIDLEMFSAQTDLDDGPCATPASSHQ